jgi:DNA polymerase-3 subunit delta
MHAFDFLESNGLKLAPVYVVFGEDAFLAKLAVRRVRTMALGGDSDDVPDAVFDGADAQWRDVNDELSTVSLFGGERRVVEISDADTFVSAHRGKLEEYVQRPSSTSVLLLRVKSWPATTRLYKLIEEAGTAVDCGPPTKPSGRSKQLDSKRVLDWIVARCEMVQRAKLTRPAAEELLELIGFELGRIEQELAKLATYVGEGGSISADTVAEVVGGWRAKTTWELLDAATEGDADEALRQLDRLLHSGESVQAIFGAMSWSLRRFADATRIVQRMEREGKRINLPAALEQAGFRKWPRQAIESAERQLRQIGRERAGKLYRWLLDLDLALKGTHATPDRARFALEQMIVRLSKPYQAAQHKRD